MTIATQGSHLAQLRKAHVNWYLSEKTDRNSAFSRPQQQVIDNLLADTQHFVFTAIPDADDEVQASATAMVEAGVWRLPYRICTFEFDARITTEQPGDLVNGQSVNNQTQRFIVLCEDDGNGPRILAGFMRSSKDVWAASAHHLIAYFDGDSTVELPIRAADVAAYGNLQATTGQQASGIIACCLVALATRGIRRERWIGTKKVLIGRREPTESYTRVMIAETLAEGHSGPSTSGERHKVRLHLRRGHIRQQPHGPGRQYTRPKWIAPMLVGYVEEGTVQHDHYETYPSEKRINAP